MGWWWCKGVFEGVSEAVGFDSSREEGEERACEKEVMSASAPLAKPATEDVRGPLAGFFAAMERVAQERCEKGGFPLQDVADVAEFHGACGTCGDVQPKGGCHAKMGEGRAPLPFVAQGGNVVHVLWREAGVLAERGPVPRLVEKVQQKGAREVRVVAKVLPPHRHGLRCEETLELVDAPGVVSKERVPIPRQGGKGQHERQRNVRVARQAFARLDTHTPVGHAPLDGDVVDVAVPEGVADGPRACATFGAATTGVHVPREFVETFTRVL